MTTTDSNAPQNVESFPIQLIKSVQHTPYDYLDLHNIIRSRREQLGDLLFIDKLATELLGLSHHGKHSNPSTNDYSSLSSNTWKEMYPPRNKNGLIQLIQIIESRVKKDIHKISLIYYIFLDYPTNITSGDSLPNYYAEETDLPDGYHHLIQGLHLMDSFQFEMGLIHLSQPSVIPTYPEQVVSAFVKSQTKRIRRNSPTKSIQDSKSIHTSAENNTDSSPSSFSSQIISNNYSSLAHLNTGESLAIAYITAKSPKLVDQSLIETYVCVLCKNSITSALDFVRSVSDIQYSIPRESSYNDSGLYHDEDTEDDYPQHNFQDVSAKSVLLKVIIDAALEENTTFYTTTKSSLNGLSSTSYTNPSNTKILLNGASSVSSSFKPTRPHKNPIRGIFKSSPTAWRFANMPFTASESRIIDSILLNIVESGMPGLTNTIEIDSTASNSGSLVLKGSGSTKSLYNTQQVAMAKDILLLRALHTGNTYLATRVTRLTGTEALNDGSALNIKDGKLNESNSDSGIGGVPGWKDVAMGMSLYNTKKIA